VPYIAVVATALIAIYTLFRHYRSRETKPAELPVIVALMFLCAAGASYSTYAIYRDAEFLEAWRSSREVHEQAVALYATFKEAQATRDRKTVQKVMDDASNFALYAEQKKAPQATRARAFLFSVTLMLWGLANLYPDQTPTSLVNQLMASSPRAQGMPAGAALMKLGFFRAQDFGPPFWVLRGFDSRGNPVLDSARFNPAFLEARAQDLLDDFVLATQ
jgi:hypothetical protein